MHRLEMTPNTAFQRTAQKRAASELRRWASIIVLEADPTLREIMGTLRHPATQT